MDRIFLKIRIAISLLINIFIISGCSSATKMADKMLIVPDYQHIAPDSTGIVDLNVSFNIPEAYISKRSRLFITPQLYVNDSLWWEFAPLVVDAPIYTKKMQRRAELEQYQDPYAGSIQTDTSSSFPLKLQFQEQFSLPDNTQVGHIQAVVSKDGCGECSGIDTVFIASISNPISLIDTKESLNLNWIEPEFVIRPKIREGKGEALLQFVINQYDINLGLGQNKKELEQMTATLSPILADSLATLQELNIYGMASADGPFGFNTQLARNRALSAKQWLVSQLQMDTEFKQIISTDSRPEGWWPVYRAMTADEHPDSLLVKQILTTYTKGNDDIQEYHIRRLPCWPDIRRKYLSKDRKVEYTYRYSIRSFSTDEELLAMYRTRPDAFNEDELLRMAALSDNDTSKMEVYSTLMHYFPQSSVAANNLAVLYLRKGNIEKAKIVLQKQEEYSPEMLTTLAASYVYENNFERAIELLKDIDLPEARYNLGLLKARQRKLGEAYELLKDYHDVNSAIAALSLNRNAEAQSIMAAIQDQSPLAEYVRAIIAARLNNEKMYRQHISSACKDKNLCARATSEPDFEKYRNEQHSNM